MAYDDEGNFIEESDDDDILKDLFIDGDNNDGGGNDLDPEELKSLKDALAEKDKQINGLLQTVKADRRKRQETKGQLDQLTSTVNSILAQREELNQQLDDGSRSGSSKGTINGIPVEFNDDGDAFVPQDKLEALTSKYEEKIQELEQSLLLTNQNQQQTAQAQAAVQQMVGEDERYAPVYSKYQMGQ
jgi:septal ring factor EnvC (AmiA/AmiB activator)